MNKFEKKEIIIISIITLIYSIISFINLGTLKEPQSFWYVESENESIILRIEESDIKTIRYYCGANFGTYELYISSDGVNYTYLQDLEQQSVFLWNDLYINEKFEYLKITGKTVGSYLGEIGLYNQNDELVFTTGTDRKSNLVIDEKEKIPEKISFMNSTYFDEIYFPRTAYEYINGLDIYEWTHPPLGKLLIAIPVMLFGMCPFAYRLMGNIAGIIMIPIIFIIAKDLFKNTKYAVLAAIIMACDNFHFAHTRLATVDSFLVLFIMLAYMYMFKYINLNKENKLKIKLLMLFLSGLFMGLAIATKWTGVFAAIGLAIIFFANLIIDKCTLSKKKAGIKNKEKKWAKEDTLIIIACIIFFVLIPILIYCACYIPDKNVNSIKDIWNLQISMYEYHSKLEAEHPFTSNWYTWPIMQKPVWYYLGTEEQGMHSTISGIGNPIIWWSGILGMLYVLFKGIIKRNKESLIILIPIITAFLPYLGINRIMFMYHYFPILPFMMLSIVTLIKDLEEKIKFKRISWIYVALIITAFIYFYPVVSGMTVSENYIKSTKWLETWYY